MYARDGSVLVLDDDDAIRCVVRDVLELEGYRVLDAATAADAAQLVERENVALVLVDDPRSGDVSRTHSLFDRSRRGRPGIIVFSAVSDAAAWAMRLGADGWLRKPFDIDELLALVARHVRPGVSAA